MKRTVRGSLPDSLISVANVHWLGEAVKLSYKDPAGKLGSEFVPGAEALL